MTYFSTSVSDLFSISSTDMSLGTLLACTVTSLVLGLVIAVVFCHGHNTSKGFAITLALLPAIVQIVIMMVNGNLGTGVAVMGAFSLVRFRSVPGTAREICAIFLAMAVGLACGTQYLSVAIIFTIIICAINIIYSIAGFGQSNGEKHLKITIPESLDYSGVFADIFEKYTKSCELDTVKTTNMGSLYKLEYTIVLKDDSMEKAMIDDLRTRNGNLEISCGRAVAKVAEQL
ncbi:MAG: DUF4956 domain-containing protein [Ruminococcus sp.]|nr:DUF4956 domain-containing protein [Ruminococcus sp.]